MSFDVSWDVEKYKEDYECAEQWEVRKAFIERWKNDYPEDRLICLAKVFANIEFMGCRYPAPLMQEIARLSEDIAYNYRKAKKGKLQRTVVSASTAAEDHVKGVKRKRGVVIERPQKKKINFVQQGLSVAKEPDLKNKVKVLPENARCENKVENEKKSSEIVDSKDYLNELAKVPCLDISRFHEGMFQTTFGRLVLVIRPWSSKLCNIQASSTICRIPVSTIYENNSFSISLNGKLVAQATGPSRAEAKSKVETLAWNKLREETVILLIKEQWIAQGDRVSVSDVSGARTSDVTFGTPITNSVATKMMQMMGWKGGGLGADAQGIAEPIKPNLQMVNRAGLGSDTADICQMRRSAYDLMRRYIASDSIDLDLVFSSDFSKEERVVLHQCAQKFGLASRSYGDKDKDRFLVVKKKLDPYSLVRAVIQKGGVTPKYEVILPAGLDSRIRK